MLFSIYFCSVVKITFFKKKEKLIMDFYVFDFGGSFGAESICASNKDNKLEALASSPFNTQRKKEIVRLYNFKFGNLKSFTESKKNKHKRRFIMGHKSTVKRFKANLRSFKNKRYRTTWKTFWPLSCNYYLTHIKKALAFRNYINIHKSPIFIDSPTLADHLYRDDFKVKHFHRLLASKVDYIGSIYTEHVSNRTSIVGSTTRASKKSDLKQDKTKSSHSFCSGLMVANRNQPFFPKQTEVLGTKTERNDRVRRFVRRTTRPNGLGKNTDWGHMPGRRGYNWVMPTFYYRAAWYAGWTDEMLRVTLRNSTGFCPETGFKKFFPKTGYKKVRIEKRVQKNPNNVRDKPQKETLTFLNQMERKLLSF